LKRINLLCDLALLAGVLLLCLPALAQEQQVGVKGAVAFTANTGHSTPVGAGLEAVIAVTQRFKIVSSGGVWHEPKLDPGDGHAFRARAEGRFYATRQFFVSGGGYWARQVTSRWNKTAFAPTFGGGINFSDRAILSYTHRLREKQTLNRVSAHEFAADFYQPVSDRWLMRFGVAWQRINFVQISTGSQKYVGDSVVMYIGAARLFGERRID
jgi:hypothetical protein